MKIDGKKAHKRLKQNYQAVLDQLNVWKILPFMEDMLDTVVQRRLDDQRNLQMTFEIRWFDITQMIDKVNISKVNGYPIDAMGYRHILVELICKLLVLNDYEVVQYLDHEIFHKVGFDTVVLIFRAKPQHSRHLIDFPEETP